MLHNYQIVKSGNKWMLTIDGGGGGTFQTLKEAKEHATRVEREL